MSTRSVQQILASVSASTSSATGKDDVRRHSKSTVKCVVTLPARKCTSCPAVFVPFKPQHDKCARCARKQIFARVHAQKTALAPIHQADELRNCMREAFASGKLPASARVSQHGSQVVVVWQGRSHTFHASA